MNVFFNRVSFTFPDIIQGGTWDHTFAIKDANGAVIPLDYWQGSAQKGVRLQLRQEAAPNAVRATVACSFVGTGSSSKIKIEVTAAVAATMPAEDVLGDLELWDNTSGTEIVRKPVLVRTKVQKEYTI